MSEGVEGSGVGIGCFVGPARMCTCKMEEWAHTQCSKELGCICHDPSCDLRRFPDNPQMVQFTIDIDAFQYGKAWRSMTLEDAEELLKQALIMIWKRQERLCDNEA